MFVLEREMQGTFASTVVAGSNRTKPTPGKPRRARKTRTSMCNFCARRLQRRPVQTQSGALREGNSALGYFPGVCGTTLGAFGWCARVIPIVARYGFRDLFRRKFTVIFRMQHFGY
jgi:hypothetical protein